MYRKKAITNGRHIVITHGGTRTDVTQRILPEIARMLAS